MVHGKPRLDVCEPIIWRMAAILRDSTVVVAVVVRTRPQAIPLAMITTRKSINGFPLVSYMDMGELRYNCVVYHNLPHYLVKRLQRIQTACASFVVGKFIESDDIIKLSWLPVKEHIEWQL